MNLTSMAAMAAALMPTENKSLIPSGVQDSSTGITLPKKEWQKRQRKRKMQAQSRKKNRK